MPLSSRPEPPGVLVPTLLLCTERVPGGAVAWVRVPGCRAQTRLSPLLASCMFIQGPGGGAVPWGAPSLAPEALPGGSAC